MSDRPLLDRAQLARIAQNVPQTIAGLEKLVGNVAGMPSTIEEANALAGSALAVAQVAMASLSVLAESLARVEAAPTAPPQVEADDHTPRMHLGTISSQNHDSVEITGGTTGLNAGAVDLPSLYLGGDRASGLYRSGPNAIGIALAGVKLLNLMAQVLEVTGKITITDQITSTVADGTPPLVVTSTALVENLHVARAAEADHAKIADRADVLTSPTAFPPAATDAASTQTLVNALRAAAVSKGL